MSSCTQLTLLSCSSRSLNFNQLSSGRQSILSLGIKNNNGKQSFNQNRQNQLSIQQYRPFKLSTNLAIKKQQQNRNLNNHSSSISICSSHRNSSINNSSEDQSTNTDLTMSHNRLKQLKQVYSSNLYLFQCLAFIGFVLLTTRLYEVNKDINYLKHVANTWLPNITYPGSTSTLSADSIKLSTTVSMFTDKNDKTPFASSLTSSLKPSSTTSSFDDENEDTNDDSDKDDDSDNRFRERSDDNSNYNLSDNSYNNLNDSLKNNLSDNLSDTIQNNKNLLSILTNKTSIESLPQPQAFQSSRNSITRSPFTRSTLSSSKLSSPSSSVGTSPLSLANSNSQSSTSNTTPLSTQVDNIQREIEIAKAKSALFHIENLRKDLDSLIVDMWSSRTTLILSLVFIIVYLISWFWMRYAVGETKNVKDVTLKTVLLLAVFSAVDIAASAGFVMVRLILYSMKDNQFTNEMRVPSPLNEYQQLTAYTSLRFAALRSTSGSIDIFASLIISFFIFIRIYNVILAMTFYSRIRKIYNQEKHRSIATLNEIGSDRKDYDDLFKRINFFRKEAPIPPLTPHIPFNNGLNTSTLLNPMNTINPLNQNLLSPTLNPVNLNNALNNVINQTATKTLLNNSNLLNSSTALNLAAAAATLNRQQQQKNDHRRFSTATSLLSDDDQINSMMNNLNSNDNYHDDQQVNTIPMKTGLNESIESQIKIQAADMPDIMKKRALKSAKNAIQLYVTEKHIAESIKQDFDNEFEPTWHCIVGRNWGSCVTHGSGCYIRMNYKDLTILLYKST